MISDKETQLLIDIIKLLNKHDTYTIMSLENNLNNDVLVNDIKTIISTLKISSNTFGISRKSSLQEDYEDSIAQKMLEIKNTDPRKFNLISDFSDSIYSKKILRTKMQMMQFSINLGIDVKIRDNKNTITKKIINYLLELSSDKLEQLMLTLNEEMNEKDQLEEWADIILKDRNNNI